MNMMGDVKKEFELTDEQEQSILQEMKELLYEYDYEYTESALRTIIKKWAEQKGWIINLLSRNENWNADKFQIQFSYNYTRGVNYSALDSFLKWAESTIFKGIKNLEIAGFNYRESDNALTRLTTVCDSICTINRNTLGLTANVTVNGMSASQVQAERNRIDRISTKLLDKTKRISSNYEEKYPKREIGERFQNFQKFTKVIRKYFVDEPGTESAHLCTKELMNDINELFPDTAREGQKITKIIQKVCKVFNLDKIKDMQDVYHNGQFQSKDFGWNYQIAQLGDAINPLKFSRHTIISVNPIDYLTMSFGYNWSSCHSIDKGGNRENHDYAGEYSAGTVSYMLDPSSIIFYTVNPEYDGNEFELQDKMQRCVFAIGQDKLYEGRVYPDGRDGGDQGLAAQFRTVMQKVIADALDVTNMWTNKKGCSKCREAMRSLGGCAYNDWAYYEDCNMSYLKNGNEINETEFSINARPLSIITGYVHSEESNITGRGTNLEECPECGCTIDLDNDDYIEVDGRFFCCADCANEAGYEYCEDISEWTDDFYCDDYTGEAFANTYDMVTFDGYHYSCPENAEADGWIYCINTDNWIREEDSHTDDYTGETFEWNDDCVETEDGKRYYCIENAEADGYIEDADGNWVLASEEEETA